MPRRFDRRAAGVHRVGLLRWADVRRSVAAGWPPICRRSSPACAMPCAAYVIAWTSHDRTERFRIARTGDAVCPGRRDGLGASRHRPPARGRAVARRGGLRRRSPCRPRDDGDRVGGDSGRTAGAAAGRSSGPGRTRQTGAQGANRVGAQRLSLLQPRRSWWGWPHSASGC